MPACDKLAQSQIGAGSMQAGATALDANIMLQKDLRNLGRGCKSRRLYLFTSVAAGIPADTLLATNL